MPTTNKSRYFPSPRAIIKHVYSTYLLYIYHIMAETSWKLFSAAFPILVQKKFFFVNLGHTFSRINKQYIYNKEFQ